MLGRAHLIGVCGSGMQSLAHYLLDLGCEISGADASDTLPECLVQRGMRFDRGDAADHLPAGVQQVIYSAAVPAANPQRMAAAARGVPQCSYAQMLGRLTSETQSWAVAGTHGKSSVCGMLAAGLRAAGKDASHIFGATPGGDGPLRLRRGA